MMDFQFNDQNQFKVLELAAETAQVSLYPELSCDREWFSIMPDEEKTGFWFSLIVKEQNMFRLDEHLSPETFFFTVSSELICSENDHAVSAEKAQVRKQYIRPFFTSPCALYKATARIRL